MKTVRLTPTEARILAQCSLHYHFRQQQTEEPDTLTEGDRVRRVIQQLHAAGGPSRVSLRACLKQVADLDEGPQMVESYYHRLRRDWLQVIAANEEMTLRISVAGWPVNLHATIDRLDKTDDGGLVAVLLRTGEGPPPTALDSDPAIAMYHALVAANYPHRRPIHIRELWLRFDQSVDVALTENVYRAHLSRLRQPVQALARNEVMARPGLHCDTCPFKYRGCPVYSHEAPPADLEPPPSDGKITPRKWIFKI